MAAPSAMAACRPMPLRCRRKRRMVQIPLSPRRRRRTEMKSRHGRFLLVLAAASLLLGGCSVFDEVGSWFASSGKKSNLRGVRIPVMSAESELKVDDTQTTPVVLPPPYRNTDWPLPGGYASNAMYHLDAPGRLRKVWDEDAGKGSDDASL